MWTLGLWILDEEIKTVKVLGSDWQPDFGGCCELGLSPVAIIKPAALRPSLRTRHTTAGGPLQLPDR